MRLTAQAAFMFSAVVASLVVQTRQFQCCSCFGLRYSVSKREAAALLRVTFHVEFESAGVAAFRFFCCDTVPRQIEAIEHCTRLSVSSTLVPLVVFRKYLSWNHHIPTSLASPKGL